MTPTPPSPEAEPAHKLWGGRFAGTASRAAEAFGASIGFDHRLWPYDIAGSAAHCRMLARCGILPADDARRMLDGLATIAAEFAAGQIDLSPSWEDIHTLVEGRLTALIGEAAARLHTARSRNDQVALDLRMFAREALLNGVNELIRLQEALLALTARYPDAVMPGYTHLQRAQPVLLAHHLLAYVEMLLRDAERLLDCYRRTDVLPLGSGALAGVPYPIDRYLTARLLGFAAVSANSMDAVADRDFVAEHLAALAIVATHLSRLAEELVVWSSAEFGFIRIGDAYSTGSSIMPQKRNPDVAELVRGKTGRVFGHLIALLTTLKGLPLTYNKDLQEDKEAFFDAVDTVAACLGTTAAMLHDVEVRTERIAAAAGADFSTATDYADYLAKKGLPFREAHGIVGRLVRTCEALECDLGDLSLEQLREASPLFGADAVGLSAPHAVAARDVVGGTAPARVAAACTAASERLRSMAAESQARRDRLPSLEMLLRAPLDLAPSV
jgi:argininosuccinate lyase